MHAFPESDRDTLNSLIKLLRVPKELQTHCEGGYSVEENLALAIMCEVENDLTLLEDINPISEYFGQMIGPETFTGNISCFYFGKAG